MSYHELLNIPYSVAVNLPHLPSPYFWRIQRSKDTSVVTNIEIRRKRKFIGSSQAFFDTVEVYNKNYLADTVLDGVENLHEIFKMLQPYETSQ